MGSFVNLKKNKTKKRDGIWEFGNLENWKWNEGVDDGVNCVQGMSKDSKEGGD